MNATELFAAYVQWRGLRKTLRTLEQRHFHRYLARTHPQFQELVRKNPALFRAQCQEIVYGRGIPVAPAIGMKTLERHAESLVARYMRTPEAERGTFQSFLKTVLARCKTPRALERFLR